MSFLLIVSFPYSCMNLVLTQHSESWQHKVQFSHRLLQASDQACKEGNTAKKFQTEALIKVIKCHMPVFAAGKDQLPCLVLLIKSLQTIKAAEQRKTALSCPAPHSSSAPGMNFIKHKSPSRNPSAIDFLLVKYSRQTPWLSWPEKENFPRWSSHARSCDVKSPSLPRQEIPEGTCSCGVTTLWRCTESFVSM